MTPQIAVIIILAINIVIAVYKENFHSAVGWILALILYVGYNVES